MGKSRIVIASCLLPVALAGCAGGGGGSSSTPSSPPPVPVATSSGVSVSASYGPGITPGSRVLTTTPTTDTTSSLTTVGTVGRSGAVSTVSSATINSANASGSGAATLTVNQTVSNSVNGFVASSAAPNNITANTSTQPLAGGTLTQYLYTTFGAWGDCTVPSCGSGNTETGVAGWYVYGQETPVAAIPSTGSATYLGTINGNYFDGTPTAYAVRADLTVTAYFDSSTPGHRARSVDFATTGTNTVVLPPLGGIGATAMRSDLNINGTLGIVAGTNQFAGSVSDDGANLPGGTARTGSVTGRFYGPAANEIGGVYSLSGGGQTNIGSFVAK